MSEKYIKSKRIHDCITKILEKPDAKTVTLLAEICNKKIGDTAWEKYYYSSNISAKEALMALSIGAFYNDRTDILDILCEPVNYGINNTELPFSAIVSNLIPHISTAIISHTHTDTIIHIFNPDSIFSNYLNNILFEAAVYSENYPVAACMQEIGIFCIDVEMVRFLIENKKYEQVDMLLGNGKYLNQSNLIGNIIYEVAETGDAELLNWIDILAERYNTSSEGNIKRNLITEYSDIDVVMSFVYANISRRYAAGAAMVIDYLEEAGVTLKNISRILAMCDIRNPEDSLTDNICRLMNEESYICYEEIACNVVKEDKKINLLNFLKDNLFEKLPYSVKLDICNMPTERLTVQDAMLIKQLLKQCRVNTVDSIPPFSVIEEAVMRDKNIIVRAFLNSGALTHNVIEEMIDMCTKYHSYKSLNEVNKYFTSIDKI